MSGFPVSIASTSSVLCIMWPISPCRSASSRPWRLKSIPSNFGQTALPATERGRRRVYPANGGARLQPEILCRLAALFSASPSRPLASLAVKLRSFYLRLLQNPSRSAHRADATPPLLAPDTSGTAIKNKKINYETREKHEIKILCS